MLIICLSVYVTQVLSRHEKYILGCTCIDFALLVNDDVMLSDKGVGHEHF